VRRRNGNVADVMGIGQVVPRLRPNERNATDELGRLQAKQERCRCDGNMTGEPAASRFREE